MRLLLFCAAVCIALTTSSCRNNSNNYIVSDKIDIDILDGSNINPVIKVGEFSDDTGKLSKDLDSAYHEILRNDIAALYFYDMASFGNEGNKIIDSSFGVCQLKPSSDTIHIVTSFGFFGGYILDIAIKGKAFSGSLTEMAENALFASDTAKLLYEKQVTVKADKQKLVLNKILELKKGSKFFGQYEATFKPYFIKNGNVAICRRKVKVLFKYMVNNASTGELSDTRNDK